MSTRKISVVAIGAHDPPDGATPSQALLPVFVVATLLKDGSVGVQLPDMLVTPWQGRCPEQDFKDKSTGADIEVRHRKDEDCDDAGKRVRKDHE